MNKNFFKSNRKLLALCLPALFISCVSSPNNTAPSPSYQYQQPQQQYAPQQAPRPDGYYYSPPTYYAPQQQAPASRYYSNPYAFPPQNSYPYYDGDQYYVPPSSYGVNRDNNIPTPSNQKF